MRTYEDNAGQRRTAVDIIANEVEFLMPKNAPNEDGGDYSAPAAPSPRKKPALEAFDDDFGYSVLSLFALGTEQPLQAVRPAPAVPLQRNGARPATPRKERRGAFRKKSIKEQDHGRK